MRPSENVFGMLQDRGKRGGPVDDLYRQLYNPHLYLRAYGRIYANDGAMTRGSTEETADAMAVEKMRKIIEDLRHERYRWTPVRRTFVPKKNGKMRALGLPTWSDKLLQEVIRSLLEAYYEPQFSEHSHGYRPERGCHTALSHIEYAWTGCHWFVEGDIKACFDRLDHSVMLSILAERSTIHGFCVSSNSCFKLDIWRNGVRFRRSLGSPRVGSLALYSAISTWTNWTNLWKPT